MYIIPNPLFERKNFVLLNDGWEFSFDGKEYVGINVPYCPQSKLSGINYKSFIRKCFYRKKFNAEIGAGRTVIRFGAVDYKCNVYVNGYFVGTHTGGYTPFFFDLSDFIVNGENLLFLEVYDDYTTSFLTGKQCRKEKPFGCFYTRTTGIWQSVWLENTPDEYIDKFFFYTDIEKCSVSVDLFVKGEGGYSVKVYFDNRLVGFSDGDISFRKKIEICLSEKRLWDVGQGNLYRVEISFGKDTVYSYFGLRKAEYKGYDFTLNGKPVFQKFVLEQGYYEDGIYTPSCTDDFQKDIDRGLELGFNGARLHQKVFDPYYLYLCDKAGYMVWGEFPSWGIDYSDYGNLGQFCKEWFETLERDFNHPSIITWCPLNEVWNDIYLPKKKPDLRIIESVYRLTKSFDNTRPCVDVSGGFHCAYTDLYDFHSYRGADKIRETIETLNKKDVLDEPFLYDEGVDKTLRYKKGTPVAISEIGGFALGAGVGSVTVSESAVKNEESWGYGSGEIDGDSFVYRYKDLIETVMNCPKISGFCYTQLYDIEQEKNGFYTYDRKDKLTQKQKNAIKKINLQK